MIFIRKIMWMDYEILICMGIKKNSVREGDKL